MMEKKISIIVPLCNTEELIGRCLESLIAQSYENLEIIVVDDGSSDGSYAAAERYLAKDGRIRLIRHEKNLGLFRARLTGVGAATGDFIGFVDSDDRVSRDYYRSLLRRAEECGSDITAARLVHESEDGEQYIHNRYHLYDPGVLDGEEARRKYWEQEGYCFIWHTVWNKLYSKPLWDRALPYLDSVGGHLIMCEDLLISSVLFALCERLSFTEYGRYYYYQRATASTGSGGGYLKYQKNISDLIYAFGQTDRLLSEIGDFKYGARLDAWRRLYKHFWRENVARSGLSPLSRRRLTGELELLYDGEGEPPSPSYFYTSRTTYDGRYESILSAMLAPEIGAVSFDIFDTLISRPLYTPSDLFYLLNGSFSELCPEDGRLFSDLRVTAEQSLRRELHRGSAPFADVTLRQIYDRVGEEIGIAAADKMMVAELEMEVELCRPRKSALNLYRAVLEAGKPIFFTSDMYLPREILDTMLKKCGYGRGVLLLSCEERATKRDGRLFSILIKKSSLRPERILHIGDNWESDYLSAGRVGITAVFYPAAVSCLEYNISDVKTTHTGVCYTEASRGWVNYERGLDFLGTRTAFALAAHKLYDNPFESYNEYSEMNASPQFLGYYGLGMHLLGFARWLADSFSGKDYGTVAFVARDGYLPMKAYELLCSYTEGLPEPKYIYTSRKAALACELKDSRGLDGLVARLNVKTLTPRRLFEMLAPLLDGAELPEGVGAALPFGSEERFKKFLDTKIKPHVSDERITEYKATVAEYLRSELSDGCATVDVGYSGRTQELIFRLTGIRADAYYLHTNGDEAYRRAAACGFRVFSFYDYSPSVTGAVRELLFSKPAPSAVGYRRVDGGVEPIFEAKEQGFPELYLITELQQGALQFVRDFTEIFGDRLGLMQMRNTDISLPLEYFIHSLTDEDAKMFECVVFEDELWAGNSFSLSDAWRSDIAYHGTVAHYMQSRDSGSSERSVLEEYYRRGIDRKSALAKLSFWLTHDRAVLAKKLKKRLLPGGGR